jgi:Cobalamin-independent synthase, N-terminal domain
MLQAVPARYSKYNLSDLDEYFAMGRGLQRPAKDGEDAVDVPSLVSTNRAQLRVCRLISSRKW